MKEISSIVLVIIGALIGAGFASGQEIYSFFFSYGIKGFLGIIITCNLISFLIYKVLKIIFRKEIDSYEELLELFIKNKKTVKIINLILNILLLISFYIMIAGFGAYFEQEIGISKIIGSLILAILCFLVFLTSVKGVLKVSEYLVPILIVFLAIIGINNITSIDFTNIEIPEIKKGWLMSSIIYCSYNLILLIPALISLRKHISKEKNIKYIALISNIIIIILSSIVYTLLIKSDVDLSTLEMPVVYVIGNIFPMFKNIYAFIILASVFTTAISIGIGFLQNVCKNPKSYTQIVLFMCITSLVISNFGFSKLVNLSYPIFGYLGIIQIWFILSAKK
ncbi:MAG: hypothetical protein HFJ55_06960 [Clostridia bacterium]|nr:hypothetical protein [Clostridia bacterium]